MLTDSLKKDIQTAYSRLLGNKSLKPRLGQRQMIAEIARTLASIRLDGDDKRSNDAGICAIEAGTGTGKTVAYTLAVLPVAQRLKKTVVISTATVALQEQILKRDLPDILKHSGLNFRFALAKGRGRYLCLSKLDAHMHGDLQQQGLFGVDAAEQVPGDTTTLLENMAASLLKGEWQGDRDEWEADIDDALWSTLTSDRHQCTGRRCQHIAQCSFFKARETLGKVDCIVANHDLVMADLALGGGAILPDPSDTLYIFDEAHHLPDIALRHFSGQVRVNGSLFWFDQTIKDLARIQQEFTGFTSLQARLVDLPALLLEAKTCFTELKPLIAGIVAPVSEGVKLSDQGSLPHYRFPRGEIPGELQKLSAMLVKTFAELTSQLEAAHELLNDSLEENHSGLSLQALEMLVVEVGQFLNVTQKQWSVWLAYSKEVKAIPDSRWVQLIDSGGSLEYELASSPLLAAGTLQNFLWKKCCGAVLTSATLTSVGRFSRFEMQSGIPGYTQTAIVESPFDYRKNARFVVPDLSSEPYQTDLHSREIADFLQGGIGDHLGVLVLFSSRRQMQDVYESLGNLQAITLCQDQMSKQKLLEVHKQRIDKKQQSVVFGLASLAEGIDLPGALCTHVVIAKLPFSVPDDPVDAALAEWMEEQGRNPFMEISLPDASRRLIQACGRLIRTEQDQGQITLMDKRILSKRYGQLILDSLPPFKQVLGVS